MPRNSKTAAVAALALALRAHAQTLPATTGPDPKNTSNIAQLEHDLASEDFPTRERAQQVLTRLSPANKEDLRQLAKRATDPEVQARLLEAVALLEEIEATDPPHISADLDQVALTRIAATLTKSLGTPIASAGADDAYTLKVKDVSFPEIMQILNRQHPLWLQSATPAPRLSRLTGVWEQSITWRGFGIFIRDGALPAPLGAAKIAVGRDGKPAVAGARYFILGTIADPRIRLVQFNAPEITSIVDDVGNHWLANPVGNATISPLASHECVLAQRVQLFVPGYPGKQVASVRGQMTAEVALDEDHIVVDNISEMLNKPIRAGDCDVTIQNLSVADDKRGKMVLANMSYKPAVTTASSPLTKIVAAITVQNADGQVLISYGLQRGLAGGVNLAAPMIGKEPLKIIITAPTRTKTITIPFEFKNLPIPAQ